jgi:hypothetical protein
MNLAWTTSEFGRTAESTHENFFASISWDALTRWFASGSSRDSPVAQEVVAVLRSELLASLEQHRPRATLALVMPSWGGKSGRHPQSCLDEIADYAARHPPGC